MCLWEFPTDDERFNREQNIRMQGRKPRYYWYELERTPIRELKQHLPRGDNFVALEKRELFQHLREIDAIQVIDKEPVTPAEQTDKRSMEVPHSFVARPGKFTEGQHVNYHKCDKVHQATILAVHSDDGGSDPYYTIMVDGREKQTTAEKLSVLVSIAK